MSRANSSPLMRECLTSCELAQHPQNVILLFSLLHFFPHSLSSSFFLLLQLPSSDRFLVSRSFFPVPVSDVHYAVKDLMPPGSYFRLNPVLGPNAELALDDTRPATLEFYKQIGQDYIKSKNAIFQDVCVLFFPFPFLFLLLLIFFSPVLFLCDFFFSCQVADTLNGKNIGSLKAILPPLHYYLRSTASRPVSSTTASSETQAPPAGMFL
jgi:hypothetical protein